ncbi:MAG: DUF4885 domain-containing protein [Oscillospiraceae bacterium]|nr:DUF4885 domain-containing protein [Oscillospiraceae bacterium]
MDIRIKTTHSNRAAYYRQQNTPVQQEKKFSSARTQDEIIISPEARAAMEKQAALLNSAVSVSTVLEEQTSNKAATNFTSFEEEFNKIVQDYSNVIRKYYAEEHQENLTYDDPRNHIWDKYKNPDSPSFRSHLSEDERAWAYDQELDLLNGGKHLQLQNPYVFNHPPALTSVVLQANQACREQIDQSIQRLFIENDIDVPADVTFQLTVGKNYSIHVTGLEDQDLTAAIEQALNSGDNGKNLYNHLKVISPDSELLEISYANGHLSKADTQIELGDNVLDEVKKQTCPVYTQFSDEYDPKRNALMNDRIIGLNTGSELDFLLNTQEAIDRSNASVRLYGPEIIARLQAGDLFPNRTLAVNYDREVDPDYSISAATYLRAYVQQALDAKKTIEAYYADAHKENSAYQPFIEGVRHIKDKYKNQFSSIFRADLPEAQRNMAYLQEMSLLTTGSLSTLGDPYALASQGGMLNTQAMHNKAMQAVREKLDGLLKDLGHM